MPHRVIRRLATHGAIRPVTRLPTIRRRAILPRVIRRRGRSGEEDSPADEAFQAAAFLVVGVEVVSPVDPAAAVSPVADGAVADTANYGGAITAPR